jgi:hypothetical protein
MKKVNQIGTGANKPVAIENAKIIATLCTT